MKLIFTLLIPALLIGCTRGDGGINEGKNGMFWSGHDSSGADNIIYQVDTITQTCFAIYRGGLRGGLTNISCNDLAKRPEWAPILTWIEE